MYYLSRIQEFLNSICLFNVKKRNLILKSFHIKVNFLQSFLTFLFTDLFSDLSYDGHLMEYELLESCVMALADSLRRWMMHRLSTLIKTKWYNQKTPSRDTHLNKVIAPMTIDHTITIFGD